VSPTLPALANVLKTSPESDALLILGRLLDSMPTPVVVTDCSAGLLYVYGNKVWQEWVHPAKFPLEGKPLTSILETTEEDLLIQLIHRVCLVGEPAHYRNVRYGGGALELDFNSGTIVRWDFEAYPISDEQEKRTHILLVAIGVPERPCYSRGQRKAPWGSAVIREQAAGIVRILRVPSEPDEPVGLAQLTRRETEVARLVAQGLNNRQIGERLFMSRSTVASHIATILHRRGFTSRVQLAAWIVEQRLRGESLQSPG
jgi:DNA-binding CsgD family transcriptional regulator